MQPYDQSGNPLGDPKPYEVKEMEALLEREDVDHVRVFKLKPGMILNIEGERHKVVAVRPNGKTTIKRIK